MINIIPKPEYISVSKSTEAGFTLHNGCTVRDDTETKGILDDFFFFLGEKFGYVPLGGDVDGIYLSFSDKITAAEGYTIICKNGKIKITASDAAGLFYALQTVKQLLNGSNGTIPVLEIRDKPKFRERGFMLDVSRHFFTVECVKLFVDVMAVHKLNRLHLHLTDDQGWRFESLHYPLLTYIGSERAYTALDRVQHRGFFTQADMKEIACYAKSKYIRVIPEINVPGHCSAALCAMPSLSCFGEEAEVSTNFGVKKNILCPGKDETVRLVKNLVGEAASVFQCNEIHLGCNDVFYDNMKKCPDCQKKIRDNGLSDERELKRFFIDEIKTSFKKISFLTWHGDRQESEYVSIDSSAPLILSSTYCENSLKHCYEYTPDENSSGGEALLWSEYIPSLEKAGYLMFPRLSAISEALWSEEKDFSSFCQALPELFGLLELYGMPHADIKQYMPSFIRKTGYDLYYKFIKKISEKRL